jgi:predicted NBD/HSP70 family sugar kinase
MPPLDPGFRPISLGARAFREAVDASGGGVDIRIALEREEGFVSVYADRVFGPSSPMWEQNFPYVERLVKSLLWVRGGWKISFGGPARIGEYLRAAYAPGGLRAFDARFMSRVYERPFTVEIMDAADVPAARESALPRGRNLDGCRIGFDAGGSDRKVSAVVDGEAVYSEEVVWHPKLMSDPSYHYEGILDSMKTAASKMPRVDAIGVSAAGIYINNRIMVASLFINVPEDVFDRRVRNMFLDIGREMGGVPLEVANDGDVTALAGAMSLGVSGVLGIAMGTSEAGGYVDRDGNITGWLNELAFVPVDYNPSAMADEWSGDVGCGVKYFSQDGVIKLAPAAGIDLPDGLTPAQKLTAVQDLMAAGDQRAAKIYESIGCYLGYALAYYAQFYEISHVLLLGRVTSGDGGAVMLNAAQRVLEAEFPELARTMTLHLPDEKSKRVGQSIAAASLPVIR